MSVREPLSARSTGTNINCYHCGEEAVFVGNNVYSCNDCSASMIKGALYGLHYWQADGYWVFHKQVGEECDESRA